MLLSCKKGCRRCCPNGFCGFCKPPVQAQKKVDTVVAVEKDVERKNIPYGYVYLYPGNKTFLLLFSFINYFLICRRSYVRKYVHKSNAFDSSLSSFTTES